MMENFMLLRPVILLLAFAAANPEKKPYPTECSAAVNNQVYFPKHRITEEMGENDLVKLTFQYLPIMATNRFTELDIRVVFHFMGLKGNDTGEYGLCLGLGSIHLKRMREVTQNEIKETPERNHKGYMFFNNFQEFEVKARFDPWKFVGYLDLDKTCWATNRSYTSCIRSLRVTEEMQTVYNLRNPFSEEFWESMKGYLHQHLGAELERLHMAFPYDHNNVLFRWLMWMLDQEHVDIYDFRMSSSEYNPNWGSLNTSWLQLMPLLTKLDLSNNGISEIQPEYLTLVARNLTLLNLGRNKLSTIPPEIYNMTNLTFLDLSRNPFNEIDSFFEVKQRNSFPHLNFFNMSSVAIRDVRYIVPVLQKKNSRDRPFNLTVLDLSFCDLKNFEDYPDLFSEQRKMTHLFLAGNRMAKSPRLNFGDDQKLLTIDLTFNNFTSPFHILDVGKVTYLNISLNNITNWTLTYPNEPDDVSVFGRIDHLNLSINTIPALTKVMGESLEKLKTVDLGENPIDCSNCDIPQFQDWLRSYQNKNTSKVILTEFNHTVEDFVCERPTKLKAKYVTNITFDEEPCLKVEQNLFVLLGIPLAAVGSLLILVGIILYAYRYEATYLLHLVKIKRRMKASASRAESDYKYDAFVCYSGADRAWVVGDLLPTLENGPEKYRLCLHERDFMLGTFITSNIVGAMQTSRNTIVVLTDNFVKSQWCKWELEMANHKLFEESREFLVLIELERLDRSVLPRHLKYLMDTRTYLEWPERGDQTGEVEVVYTRLKEALGPSIHEVMQEQAQCDEHSCNDDISLHETRA